MLPKNGWIDRINPDRVNMPALIQHIDNPAWMETRHILPEIVVASPSSLNLVVEASAGTPGLTATTEAFNWNTGVYDVVDVSTASFPSDAVVNINLSSGIGNFVQQGSGAVRTRIGWRKTGFTINYPWEVRLDQMVWTVQ